MQSEHTVGVEHPGARDGEIASAGLEDAFLELGDANETVAEFERPEALT